MDATEASLEATEDDSEATEASLEAARQYQQHIELDRNNPLRWSVCLTLTIQEAFVLKATSISVHAVQSFNTWLSNNADDILERIRRLDHEYLMRAVPEAVFHRTRLSLTQPQLI